MGLEPGEEVAAAHPGSSPPPHLSVGPDGEILDW
jgi:hypothetical protein